MNNIHTYLKTGLRRVAVLMFCLPFAAACTYEPDTVNAPRTDETTVRISVHTPGNTLPRASRSQSSENVIHNIKVVVLEYEGDKFVYRYMADGERITPVQGSSNKTTFSARLTGTTKQLKLLLLANYDGALDNTIAYGTPEGTLRSNLTENYSSDMSNGIPMYGEITLNGLSAEGNNNSISVTMLRSVARVDVLNEINEQFSKPFVLNSVRVYRANDKIRFIPDASALSGADEPSVTKASIPSAAAPMESPLVFPLTNPDDTEITMKYIPESSALGETDDPVATPTCLVVGGYYDGLGTLSYYRVDFDSKAVGHPLGQILRNHKYIFSIKQVNGSGYSTPEDALNNTDHTIVATIHVWDENISNMYFSPSHYIGISKKESTLRYNANDIDTLYIQSDIAFSLRMADDGGSATGTPVTQPGQELDYDSCTVRLVKDASDPNDIYRVYVTSKYENWAKNASKRSFIVSTDFCEFPVGITQESMSKHSSRIINVMTAGTYGFGDTFSTTTGSAYATRKILENTVNFSPEGKVPIGGIVFYEADFSTSTVATIEVIRKQLENIDVLYLAYSLNPSDTIAKIVLNWLDASPNRVFIMACDVTTSSAGTNRRIRDLLVSQGEPGLAEGSASLRPFTSDPYKGTYNEPLKKPFFEGPFGPVGESLEMGYVDGTFGYATESFDETKPHMVSLLSCNTGASVWFVNTERRIVYLGESQFMRKLGAAISNTDGNVVTDFDCLMANMWAWAVGKAVYEH